MSLCYNLFVVCYRFDVLAVMTLRRKGYGLTHKESTIWGVKIPPPNYLAQEGQTGSGEGVGTSQCF